MQLNEKLKEALDLYNSGKYPESCRALSLLVSQARDEEKKFYEALIKVAEAMGFVSGREWEKAKDAFLEAWRKLREVEDKNVEFLDVERLKEESYTAAVAAERIIMGESHEFDGFYTPGMNLRE